MARRPVKKSWIGLSLLACCGCGDREGQEIRTYSVPKETAPPPARVPAPVDLADEMAWDLPDGWTSIANPNPMRFATLTAGGPDDAIEVAITRLGGAAGGVAANINFWRQQVGLPPAGEAELAATALPVQARGAEGVMVDLVGAPASDGAPRPRMLAAIFPAGANTWFIKTMNTEAVLDRQRAAFVELCESVRFGAADGALPAGHPAVPPTAQPATTNRPAQVVPTWEELPDGWMLSDTPVAMSVASLTVSDGAETAAVTITPLGGTQDLLANINRWRRQLGLDPLTALGDDPPAPIDVGGEPGSVVDITGADRRMLAAVITHEGTTWYFKLSGPASLVARQKRAFEDFVGSLRIEVSPHE